MSILTKQEVIERLKAAIATAGSQEAFAQQHSISPAYVADVRRGRRDPGKKILDVLGIERVVGYREVQIADKTTDAKQKDG